MVPLRPHDGLEILDSLQTRLGLADTRLTTMSESSCDSCGAPAHLALLGSYLAHTIPLLLRVLINLDLNLV